MSRFSRREYRLKTFALMAVYIALMLVVWPQARHAASLPWKVMLSLGPVVPVVLVIGLMMKRVLHSDELEQRVHLLALSAASGLVGVLSLVGGFLRASGALAFDGDILIWVFPVLCVSYGVARWLLGRRYGGTGCE